MTVADMSFASPDDAHDTPSTSHGTPTFTPSPQQQAVFDWVSNSTGSAFVEAVAGSGKTTTLIRACELMSGSVAFCAFNKKIALEIQSRIAPLGLDGVRAGTFHSFGFSAWRRYNRGKKIRVDAREKTKQMLRVYDVPDEYRSAVSHMVSLAKQSGVGVAWQPSSEKCWREIIYRYDILQDVKRNSRDVDVDDEGDVEDILIEYATACLEWSRKIGTALIDFDDMIWLPISTPGVTFWRNDWVLVDEAQDTNVARRILASRMLRRGGRMLWVGDRHQAIYGFTGADANAIDIIIREFKCTQLPLTVTYRCPKSVVEVAQRYVSHIEAHETAPEGVVRDVSTRLFKADEIPTLTPTDAILCRNTRPLVALAFQLIRDGIGCHVEGRDIGKRLTALATKWKVDTVAAMLTNLQAYRDRETEKLRAADKDYAIEALHDRLDTLVVLADGCETLQQLTDKIDALFKDTDSGQRSTVTLSTVHKAKGREWARVYVLGFDVYMPSKYARQQWQRVQESNLCYVAATRAKSELVLQHGKLEEE